MIHRMLNITTKESIYLHPGDTAVCTSGAGSFVEGCTLRFEGGSWVVSDLEGASSATFCKVSYWDYVKWRKIEGTDIPLEDLL